MDIAKLLTEKHLTHEAAARKAAIASNTLLQAIRGKKIALAKADAIAKALGGKTKELFTVETSDKPLSPNSILNYHRFLHNVLNQAEKEMLITYNPASKATPPKEVKTEANYFQIEDIERIRVALEGEPLKWKLATHLLLITGCRRGEIMGLKWSRVDFDNSQLKIDTTLLNSKERGTYEDTTKTNKTRFIKLPKETLSLIWQYRVWYSEQRFLNGERWANSDFLFVQEDGKPMNPCSLTDWLRTFAKRHGLPHINPHAFRHTHASILYLGGIDSISISKRLGHSKVSTTTDIYSHIIRQADEIAAECIADTVFGKKQKMA